MDEHVVAALVVFVSFVTAGRWIYESGRQHLTSEQKAQVSDSQAPVNKLSLLALIPVLLAGYTLPRLAPWLVLLYLAAWLGFSYRSLAPSRFPPPFRRAALAHLSLYLLGASIFLLIIYWGSPS